GAGAPLGRRPDVPTALCTAALLANQAWLNACCACAASRPAPATSSRPIARASGCVRNAGRELAIAGLGTADAPSGKGRWHAPPGGLLLHDASGPANPQIRG